MVYFFELSWNWSENITLLVSTASVMHSTTYSGSRMGRTVGDLTMEPLFWHIHFLLEESSIRFTFKNLQQKIQSKRQYFDPTLLLTWSPLRRTCPC